MDARVLPAASLFLMMGCVGSDAFTPRIPALPNCGTDFFTVFDDESMRFHREAAWYAVTEDVESFYLPHGRLEVAEQDGEPVVDLRGRLQLRVPGIEPPYADLSGRLEGVSSSFYDDFEMTFNDGWQWCSDGRLYGQASYLDTTLLFLGQFRRAEAGEEVGYGEEEPGRDAGVLRAPDGGTRREIPAFVEPEDMPRQQVLEGRILDCAYHKEWTRAEHVQQCPPVASGSLHRGE